MHTPGPWTFRLYTLSDEEVAEALRYGLVPPRALTNDGQATVMGGDPADQVPIAKIECQTKFKRGQGYKTECEERDANARLTAAGPEMLAELKWLYEKHGYQSTADIIAKAEGRNGKEDAA